MNSTTYLKRADIILYSRIMGRYVLLMVCALALCFQQSVGMVYACAKYRLDDHAPRTQIQQDQHHGGITTALSLHAFPPAEQLELSEDDDPTHSQQQLHAASRDASDHEQIFAQSIRTGYLQQSIEVMLMKCPPLFLLHHQWKIFPL